jgi:hypothetical protein
MTPDRPDPAAATDILPAHHDRGMHLLELIIATISVVAALLLALAR